MKNQSKYAQIQKISSKIILKYVLKFLSNFQKLDLFKYNKSIQKEISLDLEDYKNESQKERIVEKDNFGKEYILGSKIKIFEGQFLNGKKHGKGKEYYNNGNLKFEW